MMLERSGDSTPPCGTPSLEAVNRPRSMWLTLSASRRRSNRLVKLWPRGAVRSGPDCAWRTGRDTHLHLHAEMVRWDPNEGAVERYCVAVIAHDRNGDKANLADAADRGVEIDPASAR